MFLLFVVIASPHGAVTQKRIALNRIFSSRITLDNLFVLFFSKNVARNRIPALLSKQCEDLFAVSCSTANGGAYMVEHVFAHSSSHESSIASIFFFTSSYSKYTCF